jgi:hypothetical protein
LLPWLYVHAHYPAGTSCFDDVRNSAHHAVSEFDVTDSCYSIASPRARILEDNWTKAGIPIAFLNRLVNSMYRKGAAVINAGGGHTRY